MVDFEINKRLSFLIKEVFKVSPFAFSQKYNDNGGVKTSQIIRERNGLSTQMLGKIIEAYPEINQNWLLTGEGEMLKSSTTEASQENSVTGKVIPFFDAEAAAGTSYGMSMEPVAHPVGMIEIGSVLKDSEIALRVYGNSMTPNYPAGCIVGLRPHLDSFIEPGAVYVVETEDNRYLKRLYNNHDKTAVRCVSDNHMRQESGPMTGEYFYPEFEIPFSSVRRLFRVVGVVKRNIL